MLAFAHLPRKDSQMSRIWEAVGRFFGPSQNERFAQLLLQLAETAVACAAHFRQTGGEDLSGIIDYEHRGDAIVDDIHELLDNVFILRFDIAVVGDEQQDQRRNQDANQGLNLYFKPFGVPARQSPHELR